MVSATCGHRVNLFGSANNASSVFERANIRRRISDLSDPFRRGMERGAAKSVDARAK